MHSEIGCCQGKREKTIPRKQYVKEAPGFMHPFEGTGIYLIDLFAGRRASLFSGSTGLPVDFYEKLR